MLDERRTARRTSWGVRLLLWAIPLAWAVPWALFRGEYCHGGHVWWGQAHRGGLLLLLAGVLASRSYLWWKRRNFDFGSVVLHGLVQIGFLISILVVNWLSFQTGLARHLPVSSVSAFLWQDP